MFEPAPPVPASLATSTAGTALEVQIPADVSAQGRRERSLDPSARRVFSCEAGKRADRLIAAFGLRLPLSR